MRILFGWPAPEMSVWDVAQGLRDALRARGHDVRDFAFNKRLAYHAKALGLAPDPKEQPAEWDKYRRAVMQQASEGIVIEAMKHRADVVLMVSGLNFHPLGGWLLWKAGIPVVNVFTESPYEDESQAIWHADMALAAGFTNERTSAAADGWTYLRHAFRPDVHKPVAPDPERVCDVLMVGTGWPERQRLLEAVDWTGIRLTLLGVWPDLTVESPLWMYYTEAIVENDELPRLYAGAKICLNLHRKHETAESVNPRVIETAACGCFQVSDPRPELVELFGDAIPTFETPEQLGALIRRYLADDIGRRRKAVDARTNVLGETFEARAVVVERVLDDVITRQRVAAIA